MADAHWRNLTARKMPWRPRAGQIEYPGADRAVRVCADPLSAPAPLPRWKVPGPLGAVVRLGSEEFQAIGTDGPWVLCVCASDGHVTRMDKTAYEIAVGVRKPPEPVLCNVLAVIGGRNVPLSECDWVLYGPCGCPEGVHVAASRDAGTVFAADEESAWQCFFERKRERDKARRGGYRVALMTHERYSAEVMPAMRARCPHAERPVASTEAVA